MPRDSKLKDGMCHKYLKENGFESGVFRSPIGARAEETWKAIQFAFSKGWDEAQKWEVSEAQRQAIAVQAMKGLLASNTDYPSAEVIADEAYQMADAMLAAAKKGVTGRPEEVLYEGGMRVTGEYLAQRIDLLEKAIQYAIDNRQSTFDYDTWIQLCRDGGMDGKMTAERR